MDINQIVVLDYWMILPLFLLGSLLHFTYDWSKHNKFVAIFSAVNESYWEHIKIAFWPTFLLYLIEFTLGGYKISSFIPAKTIALYTIPVTMIAIVYGYKFITKKNILALDIGAFLVVIAIAQLTGTLFLQELSASWLTILLSIFFLIVILVSFLIFTKHPPQEPDLFLDPLTSKYGLKGHGHE